jgi:hypothetical protein
MQAMDKYFEQCNRYIKLIILSFFAGLTVICFVFLMKQQQEIKMMKAEILKLNTILGTSESNSSPFKRRPIFKNSFTGSKIDAIEDRIENIEEDISNLKELLDE